MTKFRPVDWNAEGLRLSPQTDDSPDCQVTKCREERHDDWPVCFMHAMLISRAYDNFMDGLETPELRPKPPFVYYLMVGPTTVKIGTTTDLTRRLSGLRSDLQYVVAIERGSFDLERQRHREYATERIGSREDFRLSDRLKAHIESLMPQRDELITEATARRRRELLADLQ
ncbi:hypothetical protein A5668_09125 [Mycolicibacterium fortuitum]|uniref:GIY-YIG nuclease family protein n=1 Tax=Mycolicibacterium fortuitum TaxID=1766 RepID=UPI0007E96360|nr:GIY-YIG nuclease family protein [Mycolicibacterium fortuitum]OBA94654.1 hypothetical protein A5668_09125 [Mycolicibacterium fortuitum]